MLTIQIPQILQVLYKSSYILLDGRSQNNLVQSWKIIDLDHLSGRTISCPQRQKWWQEYKWSKIILLHNQGDCFWLLPPTRVYKDKELEMKCTTVQGIWRVSIVTQMYIIHKRLKLELGLQLSLSTLHFELQFSGKTTKSTIISKTTHIINRADHRDGLERK